MESDTGRQNECENNVLGTASNGDNSLKNSGQALLDRVLQKGNTLVTYALKEIPERYKWFEVTYPKTAEMFRRTRHHAKTLFLENAIRCYICGGLMLTVGTYILAITGVVSASPFWFLFVGNILVWMPIVYSWVYNRPLTELDDSSSQIEGTDKPPLYDSSPPASSPLLPESLDVAPPKYEEIFHGSQALLHDSNTGFDRVPLCAVHHPPETLRTSNDQSVADTVAISSTSHTPSRNLTPSRSPSLSRSQSPCTSPSLSRSQPPSRSPSLSRSQSPSQSQYPTKSLTPTTV